MISAQNLFELNRNQIQVLGNLPFGGCATFWSGDHYQLPPVKQASLINTDIKTMRGGAAAGYNLFRCLPKTVVTLQINQRQSSDVEFHSMLHNLRYGNTTEKNLKYLQRRVVGTEEVPDLRNFQGALCLFGKREHVKKFNSMMQQQRLDKNACTGNLNGYGKNVIMAIDRTSNQNDILLPEHRDTLLKRNAALTSDTPSAIVLTIGDLVALTENLAPECGLVTNALGNVVGFGATGGRIEIVFVRFKDLCHTTSTYGQGVYGHNVVPIPRTQKSFTFRKKIIVREMVPLKLNYANTVHSVQAITHRGPLLIDIPSCKFNGKLPYTAISRAQKVSQIAFLRPFKLKDINKKPSKKMQEYDTYLKVLHDQTAREYREPEALFELHE
jgi:hypothetical protein